MDYHDPITKTVIWKELPMYYIPYRCLVPKGLHRTLALGKCLSATREAFAAVRVVPIIMSVSEGAGRAFAKAKELGVTMDAMPASALAELLPE